MICDRSVLKSAYILVEEGAYLVYLYCMRNKSMPPMKKLNKR